MGIRIKKVLGYGLSDIDADGYDLKDARINPESPLLGHEMKVKDYLKFLKERDPFDAQMEASMTEHGEADDRDLNQVMTWDPEYGLENVLVITPLGYVRSWKRYDDSIDYVDHFTVKCAPMEPFIHEIPNNVYPYHGYMDRITGKRTDDKLVYTWKDLLGSDMERDVLENFSRILGYESTEQAVDRIVPLVPQDVRMVAEFGDLFRDPDAWKQLRPMMYTLFT